MQFPLGRLLATPGALRALAQVGQAPLWLLARHSSGDFGELTPDDRYENEIAVEHGFRVLSSYRLGSGTVVWVITEADRSATTILLPQEY